MTPYDDLAAAQQATEGLLAHLSGLSPADLSAPSLLPGWSRAHVVAHLTGNAFSHVRMLDGCLAGEVRTQYAGGAVGRAEAIEALAADPAAAVGALRVACADLESRWAAMGQEHWSREVNRLAAGVAPAGRLAWARWREVEVHRVDLDAGYRPEDWPAEFASRLLSRLLTRTDLPDMVVTADGVARGTSGPRVSGSPAALAAWLSGRSDGRDVQVVGGPLPLLSAWA